MLALATVALAVGVRWHAPGVQFFSSVLQPFNGQSNGMV